MSLRMIEDRIRQISTPGTWVPLLRTIRTDEDNSCQVCALSWKNQLGLEMWERLVNDAYEVINREEVKNKKCSDYLENHQNCYISCLQLLDIHEGDPAKIRFITSVPIDGLEQIPYKVSMANGLFKFEILKLPQGAPLGCLSQ